MSDPVIPDRTFGIVYEIKPLNEIWIYWPKIDKHYKYQVNTNHKDIKFTVIGHLRKLIKLLAIKY